MLTMCSTSLFTIVCVAAWALIGSSGAMLVKQVAIREALLANPGSGYRQVLHNHMNVQYYADFTIGEQNISGIFDTGSFELLVRSSRCKNCVHPTTPYDHNLSKTYEKNGTIAKHVFGSGPCISMLGYDTIGVGPSMKVKEQAFWEIMDHRITVLDTAKFAAIVGIGPNFAYGSSEKTLLSAFGINQFSICLQRGNGANGFLLWGKDPSNKLKPSDYKTARVIGEHHWAVHLTAAEFLPRKSSAGNAVMPCKDGCAAIVDSGTSLIAAPGLALMQLSEMIGPINSDCSNVHELPTLHFTIDEIDFPLPPHAYIMRVPAELKEKSNASGDEAQDALFYKPESGKTVEQCMPAFMQMDMMSQYGPVWILGMPFFRFYHTTFDLAAQEMRFAKASATCEPESLHPDNHTKVSLAAGFSAMERGPMDVDIASLIPPRVSGMMDFPFGTNGEIVL